MRNWGDKKETKREKNYLEFRTISVSDIKQWKINVKWTETLLQMKEDKSSNNQGKYYDAYVKVLYY